MRLQVGGFIEEEPEAALGRGRYERHDTASGLRRSRALTGASWRMSGEQAPRRWRRQLRRALGDREDVRIAVAQFLVSQGILPDRVAARGFAEFQPLDPGEGPEAYSRNRRIEIKLTTR